MLRLPLGPCVGVILLAVAVPACLGGFTGDASSESGVGPPIGPTCGSRALGFSQPSSLGVSAEQLLADWSDARVGAQAGADSGFAQALGFEEGTALQNIRVALTYYGGAITEDECLHRLSLGVYVLLDFGESEPHWENAGILAFDGTLMSLSTQLYDASNAGMATFQLDLTNTGDVRQAQLLIVGVDSEHRATYRFE